MNIEINQVAPSRETVSIDGMEIGRIQARPLVEIKVSGARDFAADVENWQAMKFGGKWFIEAPPGLSRELERAFTSGELQ